MANRYAAIVADIKRIAEAVPGAGIVHPYERWAAEWPKFLALFRDPSTSRILGGEITRRAASEHLKGVWFRHHRFVLKWYLGVEDSAATAITFQELLEELCATFRTAPNGAGWEYRDGDDPTAAPAQVELVEERTFGAVLCHYAEISLAVTERIVP